MSCAVSHYDALCVSSSLQLQQLLGSNTFVRHSKQKTKCTVARQLTWRRVHSRVVQCERVQPGAPEPAPGMCDIWWDGCHTREHMTFVDPPSEDSTRNRSESSLPDISDRKVRCWPQHCLFPSLPLQGCWPWLVHDTSWGGQCVSSQVCACEHIVMQKALVIFWS